MTPVVFFELYVPGSMVPCQDPGFVAVKLTQKLLTRLRAVDALIRRHRLSQVVIDSHHLPVEVFVIGIAEPRVEIELMADLLEFRVSGRRFDEDGKLGLIEPLAESWVVGVDELEHVRQQEIPVRLHQWDETTELEESWSLERFGRRVFDWLSRQGAYKQYLRLEWFDNEHAALLEDLDELPATRAERLQRRAASAPAD